MFHLPWSYALLILISVWSAALASPDGPLLPTEDPFYTQPDNILAYKPGQVIASRTIGTDLNGIIGVPLTSISIKAAYQLLYRTQDSLQNPVAAVTTVLVPNNANSTKLLSYQTAYDSANMNCGPSYSLQAGANNTEIVDIIAITASLNKGYYVVTADYEGFQAAFTSGLQSGYATLDSVRAALSNVSTTLTGLSPAAKYVMWGYSGGSIATEWAAELQPSYAPDLHFQGTAFGGLIANDTNVVLTVNKLPEAGLAFAGVRGLCNAYPELASIIDGAFLSIEARLGFQNITQGCLRQVIDAGANADFNSYFVDFDGVLQDPVLKRILDETGQMGHTGVPDMPMYIYKPIHDEISPVEDTDYVVNSLCSQGATIEYIKNRVGEHASDDVLGSGRALKWIDERLNGIGVAPGCTTEEIIISKLDWVTLQEFGVELYSLLQNLLGGDLGPDVTG